MMVIRTEAPDWMTAALAPYERGLSDDAPPLRARLEGGGSVRLPLGRWLGPPTPAEERVLDRARGPVLDVGCGPGRHVLALHGRGVPALGVDVSSAAVRLARDRGAPAVEGSVFAALPGRGRWRTALLLDGNVGIGGDPVALLRRVATQLAPDGRILVEVDPPGAPTRAELVRLECGGRHGAPFPWAWVGADGLESVAGELAVHEVWADGERWFAELARG
jgi:SAM-dependent methyltransferase